VAAIRHSVEISRPPEDVFAYLTDVEHEPEWQQGVVATRLEDGGPMHVGSRITSTRRMGPREQTLTFEATEFRSPQSYAFRGVDGPIRPVGRGTVEPIGDGARSLHTFELDFETHGIGKLLVPLVRRQARRQLPGNHERLKQRLER
jgi:uncharacterized protein YndB with AHSA1/START domain